MERGAVGPALAAAVSNAGGLGTLALWGAGSTSALAQKIVEVGPEDVPADNRFDTAPMTSSLVVAHTELRGFRYPVIDAHSHDSYAKTPEEVLAWVTLQKQVKAGQPKYNEFLYFESFFFYQFFSQFYNSMEITNNPRAINLQLRFEQFENSRICSPEHLDRF